VTVATTFGRRSLPLSFLAGAGIGILGGMIGLGGAEFRCLRVHCAASSHPEQSEPHRQITLKLTTGANASTGGRNATRVLVTL